jgi:hypothetical protein
MTMTICLLDRTVNCSVLTIQVVNINRHGGRNGAHVCVRTFQARQLRENLLRSAPLGLSGKPLAPRVSHLGMQDKSIVMPVMPAMPRTPLRSPLGALGALVPTGKPYLARSRILGHV